MILGAVLLALIGSADLVRSGVHSRGGARVIIVVVWVAIVGVAGFGLGIALWWSVIPVVLALLWLLTTSSAQNASAPAGVLPAVGLLAALLACLAWDRTALDLHGFLVDWHASAPSAVIQAVPLPALVMAIGVTLFLVESANIIVRASLRPSSATSANAAPASRPLRRWWGRAARPIPVVADLRGGRLIGPLERILIVALSLAAFYPVVAGLLAAKGIVRFPEISSDGPGGSKAEYFLVGSLVSWSIAVAATGLVWISAQG